MKKSGNLHYAYRHSSGESIALFDADFCPRPGFLLEPVPDPTETRPSASSSRHSTSE